MTKHTQTSDCDESFDITPGLLVTAGGLFKAGFNFVFPRNGNDTGTEGNDVIFGENCVDDDISGLDGRNIILGRGGDDDLTGGGGIDVILGGTGADDIEGGHGFDILLGGGGKDDVDGGDGRDFVFSGGEDTISGGTGNDVLTGNADADTFLFSDGDGQDVITDFDSAEGDVILFDTANISDFDDVLANAFDVEGGVFVNLGGGNGVLISDASVDDLTASDFGFDLIA